METFAIMQSQKEGVDNQNTMEKKKSKKKGSNAIEQASTKQSLRLNNASYK